MLKSKKILESILIILMILSMMVVFTGCKKKENETNSSDDKIYLTPVRNYFDGIKNKDLNRLLSAFPNFMKMSEKITDDDLNEIYKQYEAVYGANIKIDYTIGDATKLSDDEISTLKEDLKSANNLENDVEIQEAYSVPVTVTITGDGVQNNSENSSAETNSADSNTATEEATDSSSEPTNNTEEQDVQVIKYNDNWYII